MEYYKNKSKGNSLKSVKVKHNFLGNIAWRKKMNTQEVFHKCLKKAIKQKYSTYMKKSIYLARKCKSIRTLQGNEKGIRRVSYR